MRWVAHFKEGAMLMMPDMDNNIEVRIVAMIAGSAVRTIDTFVLFLILFVCYVVVRVGIEIAIYLFRLYRERAFTPSPHMRNFRILLGAGVGILLIAYLSGAFAIGFALFSVASAGYDWYVSRNEQVATPELEDLNLKDMLTMQKAVNKAYDDGLMARK
jgi:hypothetical protein